VKKMALLPIQYRDFYDFPRAFIVEHAGRTYFFDCPFDGRLDEYPDSFQVYELDPEFLRSGSTGSWEGLAAKGRLVGNVSTHRVIFDGTRRSAIDDAVFPIA
jgi:hypothetical protein